MPHSGLAGTLPRARHSGRRPPPARAPPRQRARSHKLGAGLFPAKSTTGVRGVQWENMAGESEPLAEWAS
eukprot:scaffold626_cov409-Prasinococcus_capsulatus_cf.AAC.22